MSGNGTESGFDRDVDDVVVQVPVQTFTRMDDRLKWLVWLMAANLGLGAIQAAPDAAAPLAAILAAALPFLRF